MVGNAYMKWSWYNEKGVFPKSYEKLILDVRTLWSHYGTFLSLKIIHQHSPNYVPKDRPAFEVRDFLETTLNPRIASPAPGGHSFLVCQTLHPNEPSCTRNYIKAWVEEAPVVAKWVAGFGALTTAASFKGRALSE